MKTKLSIVTMLVFLFVLFSQGVFAQQKDIVPMDPTVKYGKLDNGITYYIQKNLRPEKRVELRLAVNTGSVTEDDDQQGLAHFCEHMAFNGTKNFPKQELVSFLELTGVDFGADLNAYTSYDETVYMLKIPTDKPELIEKGLQVLDDWAHDISFEGAEIDKERGVIHEEWRLGKGAEDRIWRKQGPVMFFESKYALRDVIGDTADILHAPYEAFKRYYRDWYRPDLMAVVVVGDIDPEAMLEKIKAHFGSLTNNVKPRVREKYKMPDNKEVLVSVESDKELAYPSVSVMFKYPERDYSTYSSYRQTMVEGLIGQMLSDRYSEISKIANPPFEWAYSYAGEYLGDKMAFNLSCSVKGSESKAAYEALLTEAYRAMQHGFTKGELERTKSSVISRQKTAYNEKDKTESRRLVRQYVSNFLKGQPCPGIEKSYEYYMKEIPNITLDEVNATLKKLITRENVIILVSSPEKEGFVKPTREEIVKFFNDISVKKLEPYKDDALSTPLFTEKVTPGKVTDKKELKEIGVTELVLSNGARVILKPTDFKNDEIRFSAYSFGGLATIKDADYYAVNNAAGIVSEAGLGEFNSTQLEKYLSGKIVSLWPYISNYQEGFGGSSSVNDLETMMQMVHLYFTRPRRDQEAFESFKNKEIANIENSKNMPEYAFYDTISAVMSKYHFREKPQSVELAQKMELEKSFEFFKSRFSNAGDWTFFFVGSFKTENIIPMIEKYIGSLPTKNMQETRIDDGVRLLRGGLDKKVYKGMDPKSSVAIMITGDMTYTPEERYLLRSLTEILDIRLREVVREDLGGTYGAYSYANPSIFPVQSYSITIGWGCNPDRVEELTEAVKKILSDVKTKGVDQIYIDKIKEIQKRKMETDLKENYYWQNQLQTVYINNEDPTLLLDTSKQMDLLTTQKMKEVAIKYLKDDLMIFKMFPEKK